MKVLAYLGMFVLLISTMGCSEDETAVPDPSTALSQEEIDGLLFMYEEEKMARDLYLYGLDTYGGNQFTNISESEQRHMDYVVSIMEKYEIAVPADLGSGSFNNDEVQALYDELLARFKESEGSAYLAAMLIEETDIADLRSLSLDTEVADLIDLYAKLECASGNHIRAFQKKVDKLGLSYTPIILSAEDLADILAAAHTHCG